MDRRLGIHPFDWYDVTQLGVCRGLWQLGRVGMRPRVVRDEVEMLARGSRDAERLLHQAVLLVAVSIWAITIHLLVLVAAPPAVWRLACPSSVVELAATTLAFHLSVGEEAAGHPAGAPRLAIGPAPHAGLSLIPYEYGA